MARSIAVGLSGRLPVVAMTVLGLVGLGIGVPLGPVSAEGGGDLDGAATARCEPLPVVSQSLLTSRTGIAGTRFATDIGNGNTLYSLVPPVGWSPVNATDEDLETFGFPARPTDPAERAAWVSEWQHYVGTAAPTLCKVTDRFFGSTPNWAGMELATTTRNAYFTASGRFTQPTFVAACPHASDHPIWVGLGGDPDYEASLVQTGIEVDQSGLNDDYGWYEVIFDVNHIDPDAEAPVRIPSWTVNAGDDVRATVQYQTPGQAGNSSGKVTMTLFDITTGIAAPPVYAPDWNGLPIYDYVTGRTAEWVEERGLTSGSNVVDGGYYYLRKTTAKTIWSAASSNGVSIYGAAHQQTNWIYSNSAAQTLENASGVVTTAGGFYDYWDHCPGE